jgi:hypothetical protein
VFVFARVAIRPPPMLVTLSLAPAAHCRQDQAGIFKSLAMAQTLPSDLVIGRLEDARGDNGEVAKRILQQPVARLAVKDTPFPAEP